MRLARSCLRAFPPKCAPHWEQFPASFARMRPPTRQKETSHEFGNKND